MAKIKKMKRRKTYRFNVNRKRVKNRMRKKPAISCDQVKGAWDKKKSPLENLRQMGLTYDVNSTIKITNNQHTLTGTDRKIEAKPEKAHVAMELEAEAKAPRQKRFRLPNTQVFWLSKLIDKYDDDYRGMACDRRLNQFQETWKQLRQKIKVFKNIPEQWNEYVAKKQQQEQTPVVPAITPEVEPTME